MKTSAVKEQKVFVQLKDVLNLQGAYLNTKAAMTLAQSNYNALNTQVNQTSLDRARIRVQTFEQIIKLLDLPIERG